MSESASPPPRSNIALIISLCVNLLLAGVIVMALVRFAVHGPWFGPRIQDTLGPSIERAQLHQTLSPRMLMHVAPEKADQIHDLIDAHRTRIDALRADSMAARRHVLDVFGAAKFDKAEFEKSLARMQAADAAFETEILKVVSETAGSLTPEERARAAAWRGRGFGMRWRHGHGHDDDGPPPPDHPPGQQPPP